MARGRQIIGLAKADNYLIVNIAEEFYKHNRVKGLSEATCKQYKSYIDNFLSWTGSEITLNDVNEQLFENFIAFKAECGIKMVSIASQMKHLRRFFRFCMERGYINEIRVLIPKYETELKDPYSLEEMQKLLERPKSSRWVEWRNWAMVNYFFATGQRLSTVLNIKVSDISFEKNVVRLEWNKDKIQKYMPLSSALVQVLKEYIQLSELSEEDYLFPEYEGNQLKKRSAECSIAKYNKSRSVYKTSIHLFRHTFAKNYIINGGNPVKLQKLLNHKTIDMTMKYVNLYGTDVASDLDYFNPLDSFNRDMQNTTKRKRIVLKS